MGSHRVGHDWSDLAAAAAGWHFTASTYSFPNTWNQSIVPCPVLTVPSWPAYRFLGGRSCGLVFPSHEKFSTVCCDPHKQRLGIVNKAEVDVFLELSCFFNDPTDVGNFISGSFAFSKSGLSTWRFMVHILLKPGLEVGRGNLFQSTWEFLRCIKYVTLLHFWRKNFGCENYIIIKKIKNKLVDDRVNIIAFNF